MELTLWDKDILFKEHIPKSCGGGCMNDDIIPLRS